MPSPIYFLLAQGRGGYSPDGTLPAGAIECTQAQAEDPSAWLVKDGAIAQAPAPVLTLAQQAAAASVAGLSIALSGTMTLAATLFPTDPATQIKLANMASMASRGVLPLGATAYPMIDSAGAWHHFTAAQYQAVAGAIAAYVSACDLIAAGNPLGVTALPQNSVVLTV